MSKLAEEVAALMREVAALEIMPRFRALKDGEVEEKSKGDYVTIPLKNSAIAVAWARVIQSSDRFAED
ncbi:hypothetical protein F2P47_13105, partial [Parvibaculum sedimenti]